MSVVNPWTVQIDPPAVAPTRTMLDLNAPGGSLCIGDPSEGKGIDWGQAAIQEFLAQQGVYGSSVVDYVIPNRQITITLGAGMNQSVESDGTAEQAVRNLSEKVALLQREGGWLLRQRGSGQPLYADIVNATLTVPDNWMETGGIEYGIVLVLECLPDFYGAPVTLDTLSASGAFAGVLTSSGSAAAIAGDYPARLRLQVEDNSGNAQQGLLWGIQSRYYSAGAPLQYAASSLLLLLGASATSLSGSATYNSEVVRQELASSSSMNPVVALLGATHIGTYRVLVRALCTQAAAMQMEWGPSDAAVLTTNSSAQMPYGTLTAALTGGTAVTSLPFVPPIDIPEGATINIVSTSLGYQDAFVTSAAVLAEETGGVPVTSHAPTSSYAIGDQAFYETFYLLDMGIVRLDPVPVGTNAWLAQFSGSAAGVGAVLYVDEIFLVPLDEAAGTLNASTVSNPALITSVSANPSSVSVGSGSGLAWTLCGSQYSVSFSPGGTGAGQSSPITFENLGFAVPSGSTVTSVQLSIQPYVFYSPYANAYDIEVQLMCDGAPLGNNAAAYKRWQSPTYYYYSNWGVVPTRSQVNDSTFGVQITVSFSVINGASETVGLTEADLLFTVTYAVGGVIGQDAVVFPNQSLEISYDGMWRTQDGVTYAACQSQIGDLARLPPSGLESRPARVFVKPTEGNWNGVAADPAVDAFTVTPVYQPCYLSRI